MNAQRDTIHAAWRGIFLAAAIWTLFGAVPAFIDPAGTYLRFYGRPAVSAELLAVYRGAWGQSLLFAVGYAIASLDPRRHAALLFLGAIGKAVYATGLLATVAAGAGGPLALAAAVGDLVFAASFAAFLIVMRPRLLRVGRTAPERS